MTDTVDLHLHQTRLKAILQSLEAKKQAGKNCFYQIDVDGLTIISRTDNLNEFWEFIPFLDSMVQSLDILCYMGKSYRNTRHTFDLGGAVAAKMSEHEMTRKIEAHVDKWKQEQEYIQLVGTNRKLKTRVKELEAANQELADLVEQLQTSRFNKDNLSVSQIMAVFLANFPALAKQYPALQQFGTILGLKAAGEKSEEEPKA